jgi:hypothetical protein
MVREGEVQKIESRDKIWVIRKKMNCFIVVANVVRSFVTYALKKITLIRSIRLTTKILAYSSSLSPGVKTFVLYSWVLFRASVILFKVYYGLHDFPSVW